MILFLRPLIFAAVALSPTVALASPLPDEAQLMLDAAILSGNADKIAAVSAVAREVYPDSAADIDAQIAAYNRERENLRLAELQQERFWQGWGGQVELGASTSTGNDESVGGTLGIQLAKEDLNWQHKFDALVDYRRSSGVTEKERFFTSYQSQRNIGKNIYAVGLLQYERDRPAGYTRRFSESVGLGIRLIDRPEMRLEMDGGPAFRQTAYVDGRDENQMSGRASMSFRWNVRPTITFTQKASAFVADSSTYVSNTALTTKLFGALSSRFSFDVRHETSPQAGSVETDTVSRVTLLYSF